MLASDGRPVMLTLTARDVGADLASAARKVKEQQLCIIARAGQTSFRVEVIFGYLLF
jgi:hypothetical protein